MPILGVVASSRLGSSYTLIAENRLTSDTATVTFSSIPNSYAHLELWASMRGNNASPFQDYYMQFNGDTSNTYRRGEYWIRGSQTAPSGYGVNSSLPSVYGGQGLGDQAGANYFAATLLQINDYASSTKFKTVDSLTGNQNTSDGFAIWYDGVWENTAAINSISLINTGGSVFRANTYFTLFGVGA